jgi:hypothetical protein
MVMIWSGVFASAAFADGSRATTTPPVASAAPIATYLTFLLRNLRFAIPGIL